MVVDKIFHTCPPPSLFPSLSPQRKNHPKKKRAYPLLVRIFFLTVMNCFFCWFKKERCGTVSMRLLFVFFFQLQCSVHGPRDRLWAVRQVDMQTPSSHFQDEPFPWGKKKILNWCRWQTGSALYTRRGGGCFGRGWPCIADTRISNPLLIFIIGLGSLGDGFDPIFQTTLK